VWRREERNPFRSVQQGVAKTSRDRRRDLASMIGMVRENPAAGWQPLILRSFGGCEEKCISHANNCRQKRIMRYPTICRKRGCKGIKTKLAAGQKLTARQFIVRQ
jgi:hypothetical protein